MDLSRYLVGEPVEVNGLLETFITERPLPDNPAKKGPVDVDDAALSLVRYDNGAVGYLEGTRFATGRKNYNRFEINGAKGSIVWDLEQLNELQLYMEEGPNSGFRTILGHRRQAPVCGRLVAAGAHHRLRALVHAHRVRLSARDRRAEAALAQLRGRLQEPARARCHRAVGAGWEVGEGRVGRADAALRRPFSVARMREAILMLLLAIASSSAVANWVG